MKVENERIGTFCEKCRKVICICKNKANVNFKREFEEKHKCNFDYEYEGVFPKYSETKQKWVHVQRGQIWKSYSEFLEDRATTLTAEVERLRELIKETAMRTNIAFPTNEKQIEWFEEGLVVTKSGDFINRLFKECEFIDPQALAPERKEVGNG